MSRTARSDDPPPRSEAERRATRRESVLRDVARAWARRRRVAARQLELRPSRRLP